MTTKTAEDLAQQILTTSQQMTTATGRTWTTLSRRRFTQIKTYLAVSGDSPESVAQLLDDAGLR